GSSSPSGDNCVCNLEQASVTVDGDLVYFFFQAEDGIRDFHVTGVQTCALPISGLNCRPVIRTSKKAASCYCANSIVWIWPMNHRSEERRVGKECRSRRSQ